MDGACGVVVIAIVVVISVDVTLCAGTPIGTDSAEEGTMPYIE